MFVRQKQQNNDIPKIDNDYRIKQMIILVQSPQYAVSPPSNNAAYAAQTTFYVLSDKDSISGE